MDIKVFLTYPTSAENKHFSVKNPNTLQYIENLKIQLAKNNIKIYGDFKDFHFEQKYFYDTPDLAPLIQEIKEWEKNQNDKK